MVAAEPPTGRVDFDALAVDLDPALEIAVLVEATRVLADAAATAMEGGGLAASELAERADTVFDFLVAMTVARAMTRGLIDRDAFTVRTADALAVLATQLDYPRGN